MSAKEKNPLPDPQGDYRRPNAIGGVGASAGGLEALQRFFDAAPSDTGMAFVVVQHLSPDYKSLMVELLTRNTEMPVCRAEDAMPVEADHVYLIPPGKNLTIFHGRLVVNDQPLHEGKVNLPIDLFFSSLAEDQGTRAVAVVLSGTGSDGTRGVREVKEAGGLVVVQDEESAGFSGMPRSAADTRTADFILPPEEMPAQILSCLSHPASQRNLSTPPPEEEQGLTRIFSLMRDQVKIDFTYYKPSTVLRRIDRRISVTQTEDLDSYVRYLEQNPAEVSTLSRELLIGVTSFFRDPEVMQKLKEQVLPEMLRNGSARELRCWVAGCSTGEEAYTLAILFCEVMQQLGITREVKIFATDIDKNAILTAGAGIYSTNIEADLSPTLLTKYFYRRESSYQIIRSIREMVVFAEHNLVKDPPFTRIDLVSCRNLLIYLQTNLQVKAMEMFNYSLNPQGILLLGTSETTGEMDAFFTPVHRKMKIFRSSGKRACHHAISLSERSQAEPREPASLPPRTPRHLRDRFHDRLLEMLGETHLPLTVIVNEQMEVEHTIGDSEGLLRMPTGRSGLEVTRWVDKELSIPLSTGIQKVFTGQEEVTYANIRLDSNRDRPLRVRIRLLPARHSDPQLAAIFFEEMEPRPLAETESSGIDLDQQSLQRIQDLEQDLQFTRENLQATNEELETSNEELQATNEELLASNEELQSTNQELQSTNEELYTVNAEYQAKIIELTEAQNDVDNLLTSSRIGTLILDEDLCIRRFSPKTAEVFSILETDIGRPLDHLSHRLGNFDPNAIAHRVQQTGILQEKHVDTGQGRWYLVRVIPYKIAPQTFAGVVITIIDITPLHENRKEFGENKEITE